MMTLVEQKIRALRQALEKQHSLSEIRRLALTSKCRTSARWANACRSVARRHAELAEMVLEPAATEIRIAIEEELRA